MCIRDSLNSALTCCLQSALLLGRLLRRLHALDFFASVVSDFATGLAGADGLGCVVTVERRFCRYLAEHVLHGLARLCAEQLKPVFLGSPWRHQHGQCERRCGYLV